MSRFEVSLPPRLRALALSLITGSVGCSGSIGEPSPDTPDGGLTCTPFVAPPSANCAAAPDGPLPVDLRCTGLYGDFAQRTLACGVHEYAPAFELYSDGAEKRRFVALPPGTTVDTSDPDAFVYPDGTKFWKEFQVADARGDLRLGETRLVEKTSDGWIYTSYVWSADGSSATQMNNALGVPKLEGSEHTVPTRDQCKDCHQGRPDFILGWDAVLLGDGARGVTRENIVSLGLASTTFPAAPIPGNDIERAALGYLHANCGASCHNETLDASGRDSGLFLRLERGELDRVASTDAFKAINKRPASNAKYDGLANADPNNWYDIRPGDPVRSLLIARQMIRGFDSQMPQIGTNRVDAEGVQTVTRWIESMSAAGGYPAAAR